MAYAPKGVMGLSQGPRIGQVGLIGHAHIPWPYLQDSGGRDTAMHPPRAGGFSTGGCDAAMLPSHALRHMATSGINFRLLRQLIPGAVHKDGEMPDMGPQRISAPGNSSNRTALGSLQDSLHPSLSSPSRGPEGLRTQTHPFSQHQLQYWCNCTSDS
ncbi:UNVERIFIED_CONTAM: hypothetical protein FKN15_056821 [Acipenser sinensis]